MELKDARFTFIQWLEYLKWKEWAMSLFTKPLPKPDLTNPMASYELKPDYGSK